MVAHGSGGDSAATTVGPSIDTAPTEVPGAPTAVSTTVGNGQIGVSWTAPADNTFNPAYPTSSFAVQGYDATTGSPVSGATCATSATSCVVSGLTNGTSYVFTVSAKNAIGIGPAGVANAVTPTNVPDVQPQLGSPAIVPGDGQATVNVSAVLADTLSTSFVVVASPGSQSCTVARVGTNLASCVVTGLTNGQTYSFTVSPVDGAGIGALSSITSDPVTLGKTAPGAVQSITTQPGNQVIAVAISPPASDGGSPVTQYSVDTGQGAQGSCGIVAPKTTCIITGVPNGTAQQVFVTAINAIGNGPRIAASSTVTPQASLSTVPDVPTAVTAVPTSGTPQVSWLAPALTGGAALTGYVVTATPGGAICTTTTLSCTYAAGQLTEGTTYTFRVAATNANGTGGQSLSSGSVTPLSVPDPPTAVAAAAGNGSIAVTWSAPTNTGGSAITGYQVTSSQGSAHTCNAPAGRTTCTIGGLSNGVATTVSVVATNAQGQSAPSAASNAVTGTLVPATPTNVVANASDGAALLHWASVTGATSYTASVLGDSSKSCTYVPVYPNTDQCTITGLTNGTEYRFSVVATNGVGNSLPALPTPISGGGETLVATPATSLGTPDHVANTSSNRGAAAYFRGVPNDSAVVYSVFMSPYPTVPDPIGSPSLTPVCQFAGGGQHSYACGSSTLQNGTLYNVVVMASNDNGLSPTVSEPAVAFPSGPPDAPSNVTVTTGATSAVVSWTPGDDGGSPITTFEVSDGAGHTCTVPSGTTTCTISGLSTLGQASFTVTEHTRIGAATSSPTSAEVGSFALQPAGTVAQLMYGGLLTSSTNGATWTSLGDLGAGPTANALAYEPADGFMYFVANGAHKTVVRLSVAGTTESLGTLGGITRATQLYGGAIDPATGDYYFSDAHDHLWKVTGSSGHLTAVPVALPPGAHLGSDFVIHAGTLITYFRSAIISWSITDASTSAHYSAVRFALAAPVSGSQWLNAAGTVLYVRQNVNARVAAFTGFLGATATGAIIGVHDGPAANRVNNDAASVVSADGSPSVF